MLIDSHCHLNMLDLTPYGGSLDQLVAATEAAGVSKMLCIATDIASSTEVPAIAARYPNVYATIGVHPHDGAAQLLTVEDLTKFAAQPKVI